MSIAAVKVTSFDSKIKIVSPVALKLNVPTDPVKITLLGVPGPKGVDGVGGSAGYNHTQASSSASWLINHNLGYRPSVAVFTTGGVEVFGGEVLHTSINQLTITFDVAFAGTARLI